VEGAVHKTFRRNFAAMNASPELADCLAADWRHRHNVDCGARHKSGLTYTGHYDPWIDDNILRLRADIEWQTTPIVSAGRVVQDTSPMSFAPTHEQFGITGIPLNLRAKNDFLGPVVAATNVEKSVYPARLHLSTLSTKRDSVYTYLASAQKTKFAVTPVHTEEEFKLYNQVMLPGGDFFPTQTKPSFDQMATWWSTRADGKTIFYKLKEHLESHHKIWEGLRKSHESLVSSMPLCAPNRKRIRSANHVSQVLPAAVRDNPGVVPVETPVLPQIAPNLLGSQTTESMNSAEQYNDQIMSDDFDHTLQLTPDYTEAVSWAADPQMRAPAFPLVASHQPTPFQLFHWQEPSMPAAGSSQSNFIAYSGVPEPRLKRQRRCMACVEDGRSGTECPGEQNRKRCKFRYVIYSMI
jgi:hypothetical protein